MRKIYIILAIGVMMCVASCTKDRTSFRLLPEAINTGNAKVNIGMDRVPTWASGDMVMINTMAHSINGGVVEDVEISADGKYRVVYPASILTAITGATNVPVVMPRVQIWSSNNKAQYAVMCGYTEDAHSSISMKNAGSLLAITITNDLDNGNDILVDSIVVKTSTCPLSGSGKIDNIESSTPTLLMSPTASKEVSLISSTPYLMVNEDDGLFLVSIPPITDGTNRFAIEVYVIEDGVRYKYAVWQKSAGGTIPRNRMASIAIDLSTALKTNLSEPDPAEPINPDAFCASIKEIANGGDTPGEVDTKIQHIVFNYSSETGEDIADGVKAQWDEGSGTMTISVAGSSMEIDDLGGMFQGMVALRDVDFGSGFNTASVSNVAGIFADCASLQRVNMSGLDLGAVTNMSYMFVNCESLTEVIFPTSLATAHITDFSFMFSGCTQLGNVAMENALSRINTSYATTMAGMFAFCSGITSLNLSNMNTTSAVDMFMMLGGCTNIQTLNLGSQFRVGASHAMMCNQMGWNASQINITCTAEAEAALSGTNSGTNLDLSKTVFNRP